MKEAKSPSTNDYSTHKAETGIFTVSIEFYKTRIEDLESSININTKMISDLIRQKFNDLSIETSETNSTYSIKNFESMLVENFKLNNECKKSFKERSEAQANALISLQISKEIESKINEVCEEYEEKINEYEYYIRSKSKLIEDLRKINKNLLENANLTIYSKNVQCVPPNQEIMSVHIQSEKLKERVQQVARNCFIADNYRENLSNFIKNTFTSCQKIQALLKNPINRKVASDRFEITPLTELSVESESFSNSSEIEVEEYRTNTVSNKTNIVPVIDFSKIRNLSQAKAVTFNYSNNDVEFNEILKEYKIFYSELDDRITKNSDFLDKLCSRNHTLQQENVELLAKLVKIQNFVKNNKRTKNEIVFNGKKFEKIEEEND